MKLLRSAPFCSLRVTVQSIIIVIVFLSLLLSSSASAYDESFPVDLSEMVEGLSESGSIVNGGIVEREITPEIVNNNSIRLILKRWDFSTAKRIIDAIAAKYSTSKPNLGKGGKIDIKIPGEVDLVKFVSDIENIEIEPSFEARVVISESDGAIVMGKDVKLSEAVVSKEGITVKIDGGKKGNLTSIKEASTVKDLVESLNFAGASTRDIISILKVLKEAGALHANLVVK